MKRFLLCLLLNCAKVINNRLTVYGERMLMTMADGSWKLGVSSRRKLGKEVLRVSFRLKERVSHLGDYLPLKYSCDPSSLGQ